jgi:hypothetical protein
MAQTLVPDTTSDNPSANLITPQELVNKLEAQANAENAAKTQARKTQSVTRTSPLRVRPLSKGASRSFIGGGATVYKEEVNPTDFVPSDTGEPNQKIPDYYRNGRQIVTTETINGEQVDVRRYAPMPEQMAALSDNYAGTLASIRLIDPSQVKSNGPGTGDPRAGQIIPEYSKFFLESVNESHNEKYQLVETFNDFYVYFYGERPPVYTFSGHLLNLLNYNWKNEFMYFYQNFWRGSKAVELGARVFLTYDYQQVQGYILAINTNVNSLTDKAAQFSIQVLVTKRLFFNGRGSANGEPLDSIVRDNLIPRTENGLVNTTANAFAQSITADFLNGNRNAATAEIKSANNNAKGARIIKNNQASIKPQQTPNPANNILSSLERGVQKAIGTVKGLFG